MVILYALAIVPLLGFVAFGVDYGIWFTRANDMQQVADQVALTLARDLSAGSTWSSLPASGRILAREIGYQSGTDGVRVEILEVPGNSNAVRVCINDDDVAVIFARAVPGQPTVRAISRCALAVAGFATVQVSRVCEQVAPVGDTIIFLSSAGNLDAKFAVAIDEIEATPSKVGTIYLPEGKYNIDDITFDGDRINGVSVFGAGRDKTILDGRDTRIIHVRDLDRHNSDNAESEDFVNFADLTIQGNDSDYGSGGGAMEIDQSRGTVRLSNVKVQNNRADDFTGGVKHAATSSMQAVSMLEVCDSWFLNNTADGAQAVNDDCAGALSNSGTLYVYRSLFENNTAWGDDTGENCRGNNEAGGAIDNNGTMEVYDSTFSNNGGKNGGARGGAIYSAGSKTTALITNSTFKDNWADNGGSIANHGKSEMTLRNNLFVDAGTAGGGPKAHCAGDGVWISLGYNISDDSSCHLSAPTDIFGVAYDLPGLADNGGLTRTHALGSGGIAVNAADPSGCGTAERLDQRYYVRPAGIRCDFGAFEFGSTPAPPFDPPPPIVIPDGSAHLVVDD